MIKTFFFLVLLSLVGGCTKDSPPPVNSGNMVQISTSAVSSISVSTASSGGVITSAGGSNIISRGVCWAKVPGPTISGSKTNNGSGTGSFSSSLTGLTTKTTYYVRAYATNSDGTVYGNEKVFKTL